LRGKGYPCGIGISTSGPERNANKGKIVGLVSLSTAVNPDDLGKSKRHTIQLDACPASATIQLTRSAASMNQPYAIINLPPDARSRVEQMGTKEKFWFKDVDDIWWLFKYNQRGHGDDWSEKIACEIAGKLDLPHAHV